MDGVIHSEQTVGLLDLLRGGLSLLHRPEQTRLDQLRPAQTSSDQELLTEDGDRPPEEQTSMERLLGKPFRASGAGNGAVVGSSSHMALMCVCVCVCVCVLPGNGRVQRPCGRQGWGGSH